MFGGNLPAGTVIAGFFVKDNCTQNCFVGTAASNDLVVTPQAVDTTPLPGAVWLFGSCLGGLALLARRRKQNPAVA